MKSPTLSIFFLSFIFFYPSSFSQQTGNWLENKEITPFSKLYLHTDRDYYFQSDSIWFKGYYLDGQTQKFIPGIYSMHLDLINQDGKAIQEMVFQISNGVTAGNLHIPDSIEQGKFILRAFTDYHKALGEDTFFYKTLNISKLKSSSDIPEEKPTANQESKPEVDVFFLPEGGFLLADQVNVIGIKSVDENGNGINVRGEILDSKGHSVTQFTTEYKGMGLLHLKPRKGESYTARIPGYQNSSYRLVSAISEGIKFQFIMELDETLLFNATTNSVRYQNESYYFAIMHCGKVLFYKEFVQKNKNTEIKVDKALLQPGINRMVLLDKNLKPISERLYFSKNYEINDIQINSNRNEYATRNEVLLELIEDKKFSDVSFSSFSVSVVNEKTFGRNGPELNILSWLLIDSELKGNIESPSDYFVDDIDMVSARKLNLLMLTQGWSNYIWNSLPEKDPTNELFETEGFSITGKVKNLFSNNPVTDGEVEINISKNDYFFNAKTKIDKNGMFSFRSVNFFDTGFVFVQARNKKRKLRTEIVLNPIFDNNPGISTKHLPTIESQYNFSSSLYEQQYFSEQDLKDYLLKTGSILIEEVSIEGQKRMQEDGHFRIYPKPHESFEIKNTDLAFNNIADYLQGRVAALTIVGDAISIHGPSSFGGSNPPLFLVDGSISSQEVVMNLPMNDIELVEVLWRPGETAIFGTNGGNGVISVFTKKGGNIPPKDKYMYGTISKVMIGYDSYREFYAPTYTSNNINAEKPDHRLTLYWDPDVVTENGKATLSFFTSDDISRYKVIVEGINDDGTICLGFTEFEVNMPYSNMAK